MLASHSADTSPSTCRHDIDTASEEPTRLDVADMVCVGADMLHGMLVCLLFFGEKIPNTRLTLPVKKKCSPDAAAHHHSRQFSTSEDGCNHRSEECVVFGRCWLTFEFDESRVAGWYHSPIAQGPDPKPIFAPAQQSTRWLSCMATSRHTKCTFACLAERQMGIWGKENDNTVSCSGNTPPFITKLFAVYLSGNCLGEPKVC